MRKRFCSACHMHRAGVKTRIALEHTCGLSRGEIPEPSGNSGELDIYEAGLKHWDETNKELDPSVWEEERKQYANAFKAGAEYACAIKDERIRELETQLESAQAMMDTLVSRQQLKEKDDRIKELEATIEYAKWKPGKLPGRL